MTEHSAHASGGSRPTVPTTTPPGLDGSGFTMLGISGRRLAAVLIGWFFVVFDGYDLIVYGTVQAELMEEWNLSAAQAGTVGSMAFIGMVIGAVAIGRLSDRVGRKTAVIGSVVVLSVFTILCGLAPSVWLFGAFRLLAGIGLGGLVPSVNAMTADLVPPGRMSAWSTVMMSGVPLGGSVAALLAQVIVPMDENWGWRSMFLLAMVPLIIGIPLAAKVIPSDKEITAPGGCSLARRPMSRRRRRATAHCSPRSTARSPSGSRSRPSSPCWPGTGWARGCRSSCRRRATISAPPSTSPWP